MGSRVSRFLAATAVSSLPAAALAASARAPSPQMLDIHGSPLVFERNVGDEDADSLFTARGAGYGVHLTRSGFVIERPPAAGLERSRHLQRAGGAAALGESPGSRIAMTVVGAEEAVRAHLADPLRARINHIIGNDPSRWRLGVATFATAVFEGIRPGVDLMYHGDSGHLEFDLVVDGDADASGLTFEFSGADRMSLDADGSLILGAAGGLFRLAIPRAYQVGGDGMSQASACFDVTGPTTASLEIHHAGNGGTIVVDPVLDYSSYLGGSSVDFGTAVALDSAQRAVVVGSTESFPFPKATNYHGGTDAFIAKFDPSQSGSESLMWATYLGGSGSDAAVAVALDDDDNIYIAGWTTSTDLPVPDSHVVQPSFGGQFDGFVAKLEPFGENLLFLTYVGGTGSDFPLALALATDNSIFIAGETEDRSTFPGPAKTFATPMASPNAAFVNKVQPDGHANPDPLDMASILVAGNASTAAYSIALDPPGDVYVGGWTEASDFADAFGSGVNSFHTTNAGGTDGWLAKFSGSLFSAHSANPAASYWTYLGGSNDDFVNSIAVSPAGYLYAGGETLSPDFLTPLRFPFQSVFAGGGDGFLVEMNRTGRDTIFSTLLGGSGEDAVTSVALHPSGDVYVAGTTASTDFPTANPVQAALAGDSDMFVGRFRSTGKTLPFSTFLGGAGFDGPAALALGPCDDMLVAGSTDSTDFPVTRWYQGFNSGDYDAVFSRIKPIDSIGVAPGERFPFPVPHHDSQLPCANQPCRLSCTDHPGQQAFCPGATVTREELAQILMQMTGHFLEPPSASPFRDVPECNLFSGHIQQLKDIFSGLASPLNTQEECGPNRFCPRQVATRLDAAFLLIRAMDSSWPTAVPTSCANLFPDVADNHDASDWRDCQAAEGLFAAIGDRASCWKDSSSPARGFCPNDPVTRAQLASWFAPLLSVSSGPSTCNGWFSDVTSGCADIEELASHGTPILLEVPTCFDGTKDGDEDGVDCGGSCAVRCGLPKVANIGMHLGDRISFGPWDACWEDPIHEYSKVGCCNPCSSICSRMDCDGSTDTSFCQAVHDARAERDLVGIDWNVVYMPVGAMQGINYKNVCNPGLDNMQLPGDNNQWEQCDKTDPTQPHDECNNEDCNVSGDARRDMSAIRKLKGILGDEGRIAVIDISGAADLTDQPNTSDFLNPLQCLGTFADNWHTYSLKVAQLVRSEVEARFGSRAPLMFDAGRVAFFCMNEAANDTSFCAPQTPPVPSCDDATAACLRIATASEACARGIREAFTGLAIPPIIVGNLAGADPGNPCRPTAGDDPNVNLLQQLRFVEDIRGCGTSNRSGLCDAQGFGFHYAGDRDSLGRLHCAIRDFMPALRLYLTETFIHARNSSDNNNAANDVCPKDSRGNCDLDLNNQTQPPIGNGPATILYHVQKTLMNAKAGVRSSVFYTVWGKTSPFVGNQFDNEANFAVMESGCQRSTGSCQWLMSAPEPAPGAYKNKISFAYQAARHAVDLRTRFDSATGEFSLLDGGRIFGWPDQLRPFAFSCDPYAPVLPFRQDPLNGVVKEATGADLPFLVEGSFVVINTDKNDSHSIPVRLSDCQGLMAFLWDSNQVINWTSGPAAYSDGTGEIPRWSLAYFNWVGDRSCLQPR